MPDDGARAIHLRPGEGPAIPNPAGGDLAYKARADETGGALTAWESTAAPGMEAFFERAATSAGDDIAEVFQRLGRDAGMEILGPRLAQSDPPS